MFLLLFSLKKTIIDIYFFPITLNFLGAKTNRLNEMTLFSTHNMCFG